MSENVFIRPRRDDAGKPVRVPDPVTHQALPDDGAWKPRSQYWLRRLAHNDVEACDPPIEAPAKAKAKSESTTTLIKPKG